MNSDFERFNIPGRVKMSEGNGGIHKINVTSDCSAAEVYLHGAHVTGFQKNGEPPLLFMSAKSGFAPGKPIRGGVPICFPWFGPREGEPAHGFVRLLAWELVDTSDAGDGTVTVRMRLPKADVKSEWSALRVEFVVKVADKLTMELIATNESKDSVLKIENCLHTYFHVADISQIAVTGLQGVPFDDFAAGTAGARKVEHDSVLRITRETNRVYPGTTAAVEIRDEKLKRTIRVEKFNSRSTVVWNPWTTQKLPDDFDPPEYRQMVCVESGNVKQDIISLAPGDSSALRVELSSAALK